MRPAATATRRRAAATAAAAMLLAAAAAPRGACAQKEVVCTVYAAVDDCAEVSLDVDDPPASVANATGGSGGGGGTGGAGATSNSSDIAPEEGANDAPSVTTNALSPFALSLLDCNAGSDLPPSLARGGAARAAAAIAAANGSHYLVQLSADDNGALALLSWYTDDECGEPLATNDPVWKLWGPFGVGEGVGCNNLSSTAAELAAGEDGDGDAATAPDSLGFAFAGDGGAVRSASCSVPDNSNLGLDVFGIIVAVIVFGGALAKFVAYRFRRWRTKRAARRALALVGEGVVSEEEEEASAERHPSQVHLVASDISTSSHQVIEGRVSSRTAEGEAGASAGDESGAPELAEGSDRPVGEEIEVANPLAVAPRKAAAPP